jgi:uncharacterized membrane protein YfcA
MFDAATIAAICAALILAGIVKGIIGFALPIVGISVLTVLIGLPHAMAILLVPALLVNFSQAVIGGHLKSVTLRIWPYLTMATLTVWLGALSLTRVHLPLLSAFLGFILIFYALSNVFGLRLVITPRQDRWLGPLIGGVNGLVTGMTGTSAVPGVIYLQAVGLERDALIQGMGALFTLSLVALALVLGGNGILSGELALLSVAACVPTFAGMMIGRRIRHSLSEANFRRVFFMALLLLGVYIVISSAPWRL